MIEKIKNFLLKIKNFLNTKFTFSFIQLVVVAILINFITMVLSFVEIKALDLCFNETHTEQIEETPQTESMRIDRDIKRSNVIEYIGTPVPNSGFLEKVYFNTNLSSENVETFIIDFCTENLVISEFGDYVYFVFASVDGSSIFAISYIPDKQLVVFGLSTLINGSLNENTIFANKDYSEDGISVTEGWSFNEITLNIDTNSDFGDGVLIGGLNDELSSLFSITPFEVETPTLENAPSELVNTIPSNAVTSLPNNLGTKVFDSGSGVTITESGNEYNTFGFQIYYDSNITYSESELYHFTIDGVTYDVEPNVYRYYLNNVNVVIYTLWNNTPIYYVFDNLLMGGDWPFTLDYETRFNFTDLSNFFASSVSIVETYSDYVYINIDFSYLMSLVYDGETQYLIDIDETGLNALIYSTTHQGNYGDKGFNLDVIPQLDKNFSKMGVSQTNNMYSTIVHGGTINDVWSNAYHKGIGVGETTGYTNGYNDGIETGKTLQNPLNPIMDFISDGALVISNVFSFEILPNISLGTILLFPLAIALIWFVIKLFMGG